MIAGEMFLTRARPWLLNNSRGLTQALAPLLGLGMVWWLSTALQTVTIWPGLVVYGLAHLLLIGLQRASRIQAMPMVVGLIGWLAVLVDLLLALLVLQQVESLGNGIYPLYILICLRVLSAYQRHPAATIIPFLLGPAYLFTYRLLLQSPPVSGFEQVTQWGLLGGSLSFGAIAIWSSAVQSRTNELLRQELRNERGSREIRFDELERTANDLRARMRELHALEEGLRVITSTLSLDEVLNQIVDSTVQMLNPARVHGMTLSLLDDDEFVHRSFMVDGASDCTWAALLARRVIQQQVPLIISDMTHDVDLTSAIPADLHSALCVPLFVGAGPARGALIVVSTAASAFSSSDARHLTAFAIQAGIAVHNAEMHSRLHRQQQLLEAVVRDINDGLVVVDASAQIVLSNPIGRTLMAASTAGMSVQEQLLELAASMWAEDKSTLMCELRLDADDDASGNAYQAFASQVRYADGDEPLIAIVLHDITAHKVEERTRADFISMVSHELRNPLNSLNGFIKVVLQGRAGALTELQHEFLQIADDQIERLKGRIGELLEFNRLDAGRLTLNPQWNDLPLLATGTLIRLQLQAEQTGLTLVNEVDDSLPECFFDSERIGQVLTNLVENAIKATPPGGTITVRSELHETEVWMRVCDTGVGIPVEEQSKIFHRFYRVHNPSSIVGNHLGLGLAICQQIVEGHKGRIWVESAESRGSCFSFALPLAGQDVFVAG
jgi:two-component system, NtrC family, sensor histidine kinase KinB